MKWRTEDNTMYNTCVVFHKVADKSGGLSNMAGGYPLWVNTTKIYFSKAIYQACRFPYQPEWQREIINQPSPMEAKMKAKKEGVVNIIPVQIGKIPVLT